MNNDQKLGPEGSDVMTREEVARWLKIGTRQVDRYGIPCLALGHKTVRYLRADVLAWLEGQRRSA